MQQLKEQRMTPAEKFVLNTIKGAKPEEPDVYCDITWLNEGGSFVFKQCFSDRYLWVSWSYIRTVLKKEYGLNDDEIIKLLTKLLYKYTNNGELKIQI
jgi:hypothetical protein